jgi:hypothetical protein
VAADLPLFAVMDQSEIVLTYSESPFDAVIPYDPSLDAYALAEYGAAVLKGEYKSRLAVDIDFDIAHTEIVTSK